MSLLLQVDTVSQAATKIAEDGVAKPEVSLISIIFSGGTIGIIIMSAIFIMLFFAIYLYFERLMAIKAASKMDQNFMTQIKMFLQQGKLDNAKMLCASTQSPVARLIEKGIGLIIKKLVHG